MAKSRFMDYMDGLLRIGIGWLKAQAIYFALNMVIISVALALFHVKVPVLIALGISVLDILPVLGSGIVFVPWVIVAAIMGNTTQALQIGLLYVGLVVLRQILDPIISGKTMGVKPLIALAAALLGILFLGPVGLILGPIIAAVVNMIIKVNQKRDYEAARQQDPKAPRTEGQQ